MQGQILDFSIQENSGIISCNDGDRYSFSGTEWKDSQPPARGMSVDFEAREGKALGVYVAIGQLYTDQGTKRKPVATLLALFLGFFGAHKFYMGSWGWGIIYLLFFWTYIPALAAFVESIRYILISDQEFYSKAEKFKNAGPFGFFW